MSMIKLPWQGRELIFLPIELQWAEEQAENSFAALRNKTLAQTIAKPRYTKFSQLALSSYAAYLDLPIGEFLLLLKQQGDPFYLNFLNKYGDGTFSRFWIADLGVQRQRGLYIYAIDGEVRYIGRCRDSFKKRINDGYGRIAPKNCFIDGQATNCHLNARISAHRHEIQFFTHFMNNTQAIEASEQALIAAYSPVWNLRR